MDDFHRRFDEAMAAFLEAQAEERPLAEMMRRVGDGGLTIPSEAAERWLAQHERTELAYARVCEVLRGRRDRS